MKGRSLLALFLIMVIIGGMGYITWSLFFTNMKRQSHNGTQMQMPNMQSSQTNNTQQSNYKLNTIATSNKDALNDALTTLNQSLELITIDPYSRTTVPNLSLADLIGNRQSSGNISIYPNGNSTVNVNPAVNATNQNNPPNQTTSNMNVVFDQTKLFQLHQRIYTLAQGMMLIDSLNDDLSNQAEMMEASPPNSTTYVTRYNLSVQNKSKLTNAINLLNQAFTLVNINPYAHPSGFQYNVPNMEQLHQGIYKLSQAMTKLTNLNTQFSQQISLAATQLQQSNTTMTMPMGYATGGNWDSNSIVSIILILVIIGVIISIFNALRRALRSNGSKEPPESAE